MGTISSSTPSFNGSSTYAAQLQQVITSAVSQASAPVQELQSQQSTLASQQSELQTLLSDFQGLQTALDGINSASGAGAYAASVSDSSVATASLSSGAMPGNYSINVLNIGSRTSTLSSNGLTTVTDPSSANLDSSSTYTLSVNGQNYSISDAGGTLNGLVQAINSSGAGVQATVVNVGSSSAPDYRLSIQSLDYAPDTVQLNDGTNNLLNTLATGSNVSYQLNGSSLTVNSDSQTVTVSPGLSLDLLKAGSATVNVSENAAGVGNALSAFVSAYNALTSELTTNRGQNGGALSGQSVVYQLQAALESIASYTSGSGSVQSLSDLGLTFDQNGNLQLDSSAFSSAASNSAADVLTFLGSENGGGFLQAANNIISSVSDPTTGMLADASQSVSGEISTIGSQISDDQSRISQLQQNLTTQMSNADATISLLQSQVSEVTNLFLDMQQYDKAANG